MLDACHFANLAVALRSDDPGRPAEELGFRHDRSGAGMDGGWNRDEGAKGTPPRDLPPRLVPFHWIHK
jgi:hypothetical protein